MTDISADPCCSRGSVSEEKLPAASPSFTAVVFSPCDRVLGPELCKTKASNNLEAGSSAGRQVKARFEANFKAVQKATFGSMGCRPRAGSVLHCHGV